MKAIPSLRRRDALNCVPCCKRCNVHKGGMPAPAYSHVRLDVEKHKLVHRQWSLITQQFRDAWHDAGSQTIEEDADYQALVVYVKDEMTAPLNPPYEWPLAPSFLRGHPSPEVYERVRRVIEERKERALSWEEIVRGHDVRMQAPAGPANAPFSKNPPIKRVYRLDERGKVIFDYVVDESP
jgi:hypothetical protein